MSTKISKLSVGEGGAMQAYEGFQLIEARTFDKSSQKNWQDTRKSPRAIFSQGSTYRSDSEHMTAIIGRNGTGKSHLLGSIVQAFTILEDLLKGKRTTVSNFPLAYLDYIVDGFHCTLQYFGHQDLRLARDGIVTDISGFPLPQRVVALTISPFDKFPVPRMIPNSVSQWGTSLYHYLGLRDRFGKAAIETLLFRALSNLFDSETNDAMRRANISAVFNFLDLVPELSVVYSKRIPQSLQNSLQRGASLDDPIIYESEDQSRKVLDVLRSVPEFHLRFLLDVAMSRLDKGALRVRADFAAGGILDDTFDDLQPLRRAGFLRLSAVEITHKNGERSNLKKASSGQVSMISSLLALSSVITNGSLVLIDEPELSLHPEWQIKYVDLLLRTFARYQGCHFVVATHSPLVVSELPGHATIISLDDDKLPADENLKGQSADYLLAVAFGLPSSANLHVKERLVSAIKLVANGQANSNEFAKELQLLLKFRSEMAHGDPAIKIINSLEAASKLSSSEAGI